ncbi:FAD-dependent monooxygenase [Streptomyces sp. NPDC087300]|uniref:FAD-dependent monooxygenase n=1 Tax=Streptomyces sp. NPDC087300 TaxID=3365780 RepID=UPI0038003306
MGPRRGRSRPQTPRAERQRRLRRLLDTGIQDAWNLTAKLVSAVRGDAGPRVLDDYESERRAVGRLTVEQVPGSRTPSIRRSIAMGLS